MKKRNQGCNNGGHGTDSTNPTTRATRDIGLRAPQPFSIIQKSTPEGKQQYEEEKQNRDDQLEVIRDQLVAAQRLNKLTKWAAAMSFLGLLILAYSIRLNSIATQAAVTSADAAKKAVDSQADQFRLDNRAWIKIEVVSTGGDQRIIIPQDYSPIWAKYTISNVGKTFARNVVVYSDIVVIPNMSSAPLEDLDLDKPNLGYQTELSGMFPNDSPIPKIAVYRNDGKLRRKQTTPQEMEGIRNGSMYVVVYGIATYDDIFANHHRTKYCYWQAATAPSIPTEPKMVYDASSCTRINSVDDGNQEGQVKKGN